MRIFSFLLPLVLFFTGCKEQQADKFQLKADDIKLTTLSGTPLDITAYKGKTIFINFWATWCKPCVQEMPSLQRLTEILSKEDIVFLFASDETVDEIATFRSARNYTMNFVKAESLTDLNITGLPTTFIFDRNGQQVFSEMGARKWDSRESIALLTKFAEQ
jgi:thiol-disulfide isomerase/thioredoxin